MSTSLSLRIEEEVLREVDDAARELHVPREAFLDQAIRNYLARMSQRRLRARLRKESELTAAESLRVLKEFEAIAD